MQRFFGSFEFHKKKILGEDRLKNKVAKRKRNARRARDRSLSASGLNSSECLTDYHRLRQFAKSLRYKRAGVVDGR